MSPQWRRGTGTHLSGSRGPSFAVTARARGKGGVGGRLVKGNDAPTLVPRGLSVSAQPHMPTLHGALYGHVGVLKDRTPCVGLTSALLVLTTRPGRKTTPHVI